MNYNTIYLSTPLEDFFYDASANKLTTSAYVVIAIVSLLVIKGLYNAFKYRGYRFFNMKMDKMINKKLKKQGDYKEIRNALDDGNVLYMSMSKNTSYVVATKVEKYSALVQIEEDRMKLFTMIGKDKYFKNQNVDIIPFNAIDLEKSKVKKNTIILYLLDDKRKYILTENRFSGVETLNNLINKLNI